MTWDYRLIRHADGSVGLYEVHYDAKGRPVFRTDRPVSFVGADAVEVAASLRMALTAVETLPVLDDPWPEDGFEITPDGRKALAAAQSVELPIRIESTPNKREHWATKAARAKQHRAMAIAVPRHTLPCTVTLTRIAPRKLDDDNLVNGFKALRDGIADRLGADDGGSAIKWRYRQERGRAKEYAVRVEISGG